MSTAGRIRSVTIVAACALVMTLVTTTAVAAPAGRRNGSARDASRLMARDATIEALEPGGWHLWFWDGFDGADGPTFTFASDTAMVLTITDAYCPGDRFTLTDRGTALGTTTMPERSTCGYRHSKSRPDRALEDDAYTHGWYVIRAGSAEVEVTLARSPFGGGAAWVRIDPMRKSLCKEGGWRSYGGEEPQFSNQGGCVALVASG